MFECACGGFGDRFSKPGRSAFRDNNRPRSGRVRGTDDRAKVVGIFDTVQDNEEFSRGGDIVKFGVLLFSSERNYSLVGFDAGEPIQCATILETDRRTAFARKVDDFLQAMSARAPSDEYAIERAGALIADGWTSHATVDAGTFRPTRVPTWLQEAIASAESQRSSSEPSSSST